MTPTSPSSFPAEFKVTNDKLFVCVWFFSLSASTHCAAAIRFSNQSISFRTGGMRNRCAPDLKLGRRLLSAPLWRSCGTREHGASVNARDASSVSTPNLRRGTRLRVCQAWLLRPRRCTAAHKVNLRAEGPREGHPRSTQAPARLLRHRRPSSFTASPVLTLVKVFQRSPRVAHFAFIVPRFSSGRRAPLRNVHLLVVVPVPGLAAARSLGHRATET